MRILNRIYLVLAIVFGVVAILQSIRWSMHAGAVSYGYLLTFLPSAVWTSAYLLTRKIPQRLAHVAAIMLGLVVCGLWGFMSVFAEAVANATTEVTNVKRYDEILTNYWNFAPELVDHFPRPIPAKAQEVRFSFLPGFLQGGAHVQLRYASTPQDISDLYQRFVARKTKSFFGGDMNEHMNEDNGMPTTFFYCNLPQSGKFPQDYEVMIFDPVLTNRPPGFYWNHGQSHGIAISTNRNEIVFWAESW